MGHIRASGYIFCEADRIKGALKKGNLWLIPADAEKPVDGRYKENKKNKHL